MEINGAVVFLVGSLLVSFGLLIIGMLLLALNNLYSRFWKPVRWTVFNPVEYRFIDSKTLKEVEIQFVDEPPTSNKGKK
jgi:hypothetical protein